MDKELLYNQSGIKDETAYKAITNIHNMGVTMNGYEINKGEIWEVEGNGYGTKLVVVLNCYDRYAATVMLQEQEPGSNAARVIAHGIMYADAGRLGWTFYDKMVDFVRALSAEEDRELRKAIAEALELEAICEQIPEDVGELTLRLEAARAEADVLRRNMAEAKETIERQERQLETAAEAAKEYTELPPCVSVEDIAENNSLREELVAARREAKIYKELYENMLERALK